MLCLATLALASPSMAAVTIDLVPVGFIGNVSDTNDGDGYTAGIQSYGAVGYGYYIGKYEVTNAQYAEFLNAKAATDTNSLYNPNMATDANGGITRGGSDGSYTYAVKSGQGNQPVNYVSFYDAMRFSNWMHNGQGAGDTEAGAYNVAAGGLTVHSSIAQYWIPTEDEWNKAAYYDPTLNGGLGGYYLYPTMSNTQPTSAAAPTAIPNAANYRFDDGLANGINGGYAMTQSSVLSSSQNYLSNVGAYSSSASYFGTFDQGGNVNEFNEAIISGVSRGTRGGQTGLDVLSLGGLSSSVISSFRLPIYPYQESNDVGFRLASAVPEPSRSILLVAALTGVLIRRRRSL